MSQYMWLFGIKPVSAAGMRGMIQCILSEGLSLVLCAGILTMFIGAVAFAILFSILILTLNAPYLLRLSGRKLISYCRK